MLAADCSCDTVMFEQITQRLLQSMHFTGRTLEAKQCLYVYRRLHLDLENQGSLRQLQE